MKQLIDLRVLKNVSQRSREELYELRLDHLPLALRDIILEKFDPSKKNPVYSPFIESRRLFKESIVNFMTSQSIMSFPQYSRFVPIRQFLVVPEENVVDQPKKK